jgi:nucleoside-diphosphate-sugar epimerase
MKVIVTGASGFIGRNLLLKLPKSWEVLAFYNQDQQFPAFLDDNNLTHIQEVQCDLTNLESIDQFVLNYGSQFDCCVYLAANGDPAFSVKEPITDFKQNALAILQFLSRLSFKKFIFFSSGAVYDGLKGNVSPATCVHPHLPYAISKLASEQYVQYFHKKGSLGAYVILRFFGAFGPYEPARKIYTKLVQAFAIDKKNEFTITGDGRNLIDAMFVEDTVDGILNVIRSKVVNCTVDFCHGKPLTIDALVKTAAKVFKVKDLNVIHQGKVPEYILFRASSLAMRKKFKFKPKVSLENGLLKLAQFLKA